MRIILSLVLIVLFVSCKEKKTVNTSSIEQKTVIVIDSLESSIQVINDQIAELAQEQEYLLETLDTENVEIKNMEKKYLELLQQREELQIEIGNLKAGT